MKRRDALKLLVTSGCVLYGLEESAALQAPTRKTLAHGNTDVVVDHWLNSSGMSIAAVAMEDTRGAGSESQALQDARCVEQVAALVNGRRHKGPVSRIVTQRRHAGPRGASLENQLRKASRNVGEIVSIPDSQSDILQFLGFITGTIYGAFSGYDRPPKNKTKRELLAYVETKLGGKPLWAPVNHPKLVVRVVGKA